MYESKFDNLLQKMDIILVCIIQHEQVVYLITICCRFTETIRKLLDDPTAELMRYRLKLSFMSVIVLHEDPPATPGDRLDVGQTSAEKLKSLVEAYYGRVEGIVTSGMGTELSDLRKQFSQACRHDHIW